MEQIAMNDSAPAMKVVEGNKLSKIPRLNWKSIKNDSNSSKIISVAAVAGHCQGSEQTQDVTYTNTKAIGNGSFGVVYQARLCSTGELVAIKSVLLDKRYKNRELEIMQKLDHCNVVKLRYFYYSSGDKKGERYLNLMLEFMPETVYKVSRHYTASKLQMPSILVKLYMYQLFRALAYIHSLGICHRDIKPPNLLVHPDTGVLKLCDFGSAKPLLAGEPNVSYICSRFYRAPELIFGATSYTCSIDVWSAGCVLAELLLGQPLFPGDSGLDQLVQIIRVLGTPSREQLTLMNPEYTEFRFPQIRAHPWQKVFRTRTPAEAVQLVSRLLQYAPAERPAPLEVCADAYFSELRHPDTRLPSGRHLPPIFNFTSAELALCGPLVESLLPPGQQAAAEVATSSAPADPAVESETDTASVSVSVADSLPA